MRGSGKSRAAFSGIVFSDLLLISDWKTGILAFEAFDKQTHVTNFGLTRFKMDR